MMINFRVYLIIAVCVSVLCSAIAYFDTGGATASIFTSIGEQATPYVGNTIADFVTQPLANAFTDIYWAIAAGVLWPLMIIWFFLFLLLMGASIFGPALSGVQGI